MTILCWEKDGSRTALLLEAGVPLKLYGSTAVSNQLGTRSTIATSSTRPVHVVHNAEQILTEGGDIWVSSDREDGGHSLVAAESKVETAGLTAL